MRSLPDDELVEHERINIYRAIKRSGVKTVADQLGISRLALANACARLDVAKGTIALIRQNFDKIGDKNEEKV